MKDPREIIDQLSAGDALAILKALARDDERLAARIAEIATDYLSDVDPEAIASLVLLDLSFLEVEEVWDRAGPTRHGYVDPTEAAYKMVEEVLNPYLEELQKYRALGMNTEVNRVCMGLLLGLYEFEQEETASEFRNWAPDVADSFARRAVKAWKAGGFSRAGGAEVNGFAEKALGGWGRRLLASHEGL